MHKINYDDSSFANLLSLSWKFIQKQPGAVGQMLLKHFIYGLASVLIMSPLSFLTVLATAIIYTSTIKSGNDSGGFYVLSIAISLAIISYSLALSFAHIAIEANTFNHINYAKQKVNGFKLFITILTKSCVSFSWRLFVGILATAIASMYAQGLVFYILAFVINLTLILSLLDIATYYSLYAAARVAKNQTGKELHHNLSSIPKKKSLTLCLYLSIIFTLANLSVIINPVFIVLSLFAAPLIGLMASFFFDIESRRDFADNPKNAKAQQFLLVLSIFTIVFYGIFIGNNVSKIRGKIHERLKQIKSNPNIKIKEKTNVSN